MILAFKQKKKNNHCLLYTAFFVILYNCITGGDKKRNILFYFLDCYLKKKKIVLGWHINVISITVYKDINVCPV